MDVPPLYSVPKSNNIVNGSKKFTKYVVNVANHDYNVATDEINAVTITKSALINNFKFIKCSRHVEDVVDLSCLIDTEATVSVINYDAWTKLGKPKIELSRVGHILLSDGSKVLIQGEIKTSIIVGSSAYPIKLLLLPNWRYEVILGLDFLRSIKAIIHTGKNTLEADGQVIAQCNAAYGNFKNGRAKYDVIAQETIKIPAGHEARIVAEVVGSIPDGNNYIIYGKHFALGLYQNICNKPLVVFSTKQDRWSTRLKLVM